MANQSDFTPEEWKALETAPMMAGMYVTLSQLSGPIGLVEESYAIAKEITVGTSSPNELVKAIADGIKTGGKPKLPDMPGDREKARGLLLDGVRQAMAALGKAPADADAYGGWVYAVAQRAAHAAKEGGFLGIGGTPVSGAETAALNELAAALGVRF
jgi:hypothetical protein